MEDETIIKLEEIINEEKPEERADEIFQLITTMHQKLQSKREVTSDAMTVLNKSAEYLFEPEMKDLLKKPIYSGLRCRLFDLAANDLTNIDHILYAEATDPQFKDKLKLPDASMRKLIAQFETRSAMIKLSRGGELSETLRSIYASYSSLNELCSATWRTISQLLNQHQDQTGQTPSAHFRLIADKRLIKKLWSSQSELRRLICDNDLPPELGDDIEQCKVTKLSDLPFDKYEELCQPLTKHEKEIFAKLYRKENSFSASRVLQEPTLKNELNEKVNKAKAIVERLRNQDNDGQKTINLKEISKEELEVLLFFKDGDNIIPSLNEISQVINLAERRLNISTAPFETDEDLIAGIDGGLALHCICYGLSDDGVSKLAPEPFFRKPKICSIKETISIQPHILEEYCLTKESVINLKNLILSSGPSFYEKLKARGFGLNGEASSNHQPNYKGEEKTTSQLSLLSFHIYPTATLRIDGDQLILSQSAINSLEDVDDVSSAETFLNRFGSHFSRGLHHLGGVLCHSIELISQEEQSEGALKNLAKKVMEANLRSGSLLNGNIKQMDLSQENFGANNDGKITSRSEVTSRGPPVFQPRLFEELLRVNSRSWHVIDRGVSSETLVPIWTVVDKKNPQAANFLRKAWLRRTADIKDGIVNIEWQKIKNREQTSVNNENEQRIISLLNSLKDTNLETVDEGDLLEKLNQFFQALQTLEYQNSNKSNEVSYWVTYVAKQSKLCALLLELVRHWKLGDTKFQEVFRYLSSIIDQNKIEQMDHAGFKLDPKICEMLKSFSLQTQPEDSFKARLATTNLQNIVQVLREEFSEHQNHDVQGNSLQWKIQTILTAALNNATEEDNKMRNGLEDLLVKIYEWKNNAFGESIPISREGFLQLFEKIEKLRYETNALKPDPGVPAIPPEDPIPLKSKVDEPNNSSTSLEIKPMDPIPTRNFSSRQPSPELPKRLPRPRKVIEQRKPYAALLIDRPLSKIKEDNSIYLMSCLRYRMRLAVSSPSVSRIESATTGKDMADYLQAFEVTNSSPVIGDNTTSVSLYDTLLDLVDEFDAAGKEEIFRLLLERRSAIPLFIPDSNSNHLMLLQDISKTLSISSKSINMGKDKSLGRVAIVSCRNRSKSQTPELLKSLFHVESLHRQDFAKNCATEYPTTAEIAFGCIPPEANQGQSIQHFIVLHVVGDFEPLMSFIRTFADYLLIEDSSNRDEKGSFYRSALLNQKNSSSLSSKDQVSLNEASANLNGIKSITLWRQSTGGVQAEGEPNRFCIDGPFGDKIIIRLKNIIKYTFNNILTDLTNEPNRINVSGMHSQLPQTIRSVVDCLIPWDFENLIIKYKSKLADIRANEFILQMIYRKQSVHEENKWEYKLDEERKKIENEKINWYINQRKKEVGIVRNHPFLKVFQQILNQEDPCIRVLAIRQLERAISSRSDNELDEQRKEINRLYERSGELSNQTNANNASSNRELDEIKKKLQKARNEFNESVLSMEHLWRELSHLYAADSQTFSKLPKLAAQHLFDGFSIELLDGDSNLVNLEWMKQVIHELCKRIDKAKQRIFVLSIMGVQSSGKSTLLNTMFGIQMRTSVGMCTRGVNMQLLAVEGRSEYDYILILDTEGTRAPEYHGMEGSEKRDNKMATLSILLADATIIVNPGENDAAIKDILPIVLMAYQGSNLAEDNGGRLSNMMFFVYNRIDTTQKDKLGNIIQSLSTSLNDAFDAVQNKIRPTQPNSKSVPLKSESPFRNFKLDASNSSESDVRILGNVKEKYEAPADVPDPAYGEALAEFREHIHRRVTSPRGGNSALQWKARSLNDFAKYLDDVWKCIGSANFTLHFASIVERSNFDNLEMDYKKCEQDLAKSYQEEFRVVQKAMITEKGNNDKTTETDSLPKFERRMQQAVNKEEIRLDQVVEDIVNQKGREKWKLQYQQRWKKYKQTQIDHWKGFLKSSFDTLFTFDSQVEKFKKDMRQRIRSLFSSKKATEWTQAQKEDEFNRMYEGILAEAKTKFPEIDVEQQIKKVYQTNSLINSAHIISLEDSSIEKECNEKIYYQISEDTQREALTHKEGFFQRLTKWSPINLIRGLGYTKENQGAVKIEEYERAIFNCVRQTIVGKACYDDSIGDNIIKQTVTILQDFPKENNNEKVKRAHIYARTLAIFFLKEVQREWNLNNSVYAKLNQESSRSAMWNYFMKASEGVKSTQLFICHIQSILKGNLVEAFEKEMIYSTTNEIRNEKWLNNGKFMQNHIDLFLIELLEDGKLHQVLQLISNPQKLYKEVLEKLIAKKVPRGKEEKVKFTEILKTQIRQAISFSTSVEGGRATRFVDTLRNGCVKILLSPCLGEKLLINCKGEYDDCDAEDADAFRKSCEDALIDTVDQALSARAFQYDDQQHDFAQSLSKKVIEYMKTQNDAAARPRCDASCPWCGSQCLDTVNHDTKLQLHDTTHQPSGLHGTKKITTHVLVPLACSKYDDETQLYHGDKLLGEFKDFESIFSGWKKPKWKENWPLREYIFATYQDDLARFYQHANVKVCSDIPEEYKRNLQTIRENLEKEI